MVHGKYIEDYADIDNEGRIVCGYCGKSYILLPTHTWAIHGVTADEYRAEFGIPGYVGLVTRELSERKTTIMKDRIEADPEWWDDMREKVNTSESREKASASFTRRYLGGQFDLDLEPPPEFFDGSAQAAQKELRETDPEWVEAVKEKQRGHRGGWIETDCEVCGDSFGAFKSYQRVICYRDSCYDTQRLRLVGQARIGWLNKVNSDPEFKARILKGLNSSEAKKKSAETYKRHTAERMMKGPHDERNYRRGCRCDECRADHTRQSRIYRETGKWPHIGDDSRLS